MDLINKETDINEGNALAELKLEHERIVKEIQRRESLLKFKQQSNGYEKIENEDEKDDNEKDDKEEDDKDDTKLSSSYKKEEESFWKRGLNLLVSCLGIELYILNPIDENIENNN